ncbi:putative sodium-coupled neutral amino acid transporter 10 [Mya arenaria]|uniref:putative sodium-coupled neutral amino acid transporter 10 n=1 Tax=Mya arenaria TaxID=6604 RepID=UPI0022E44DEF|nr:putative sodium-coupled neutral amino acid transporter 10 [Mya arenaria]
MVPAWQNNWPFVINVGNSIIGVTVLAMPFCFQACGIVLGSLMLFFSTWLTMESCQLLMKAGVTSRRRSYSLLASYTHGSSGKLIVEIGMIGLQLGTLVAQVVIIGDLGPAIVSKFTGLQNTSNLRTGLIVMLCLCVGLPLAMLKDVRTLAKTSTLCILFYAFFTVYVFLLSIPNLLSGNWYSKVNFWRTEGFFQCLPIFSFAFGCQTQLFIVYDALADPSLKRINSIVSSAVHMCTVCYLLVGFFGYIAFCSIDDISGDIVNHFKENVTSDLIKLCFVCSIAVSIPLIVFPCRASLFTLLFPQKPKDDVPSSSKMPELHFHLLTVTIVCSAMVVGILIPNIEFVLGLNGATMGTLICYIFPALFFLNVMADNAEKKNVGRLVLVLGVTIMIVCTYTTLSANSTTQLSDQARDPINDELNKEINKANEIINDIKKVEVPNVEAVKRDSLSNERHEPPIPQEPEENKTKSRPKIIEEDDKRLEKKQGEEGKEHQSVEEVKSGKDPKQENKRSKDAHVPPDVKNEKIIKVEDMKKDIGREVIDKGAHAHARDEKVKERDEEKDKAHPDDKFGDKSKYKQGIENPKAQDEELKQAEKGEVKQEEADKKQKEILEKLEQQQKEQQKLIEEQKEILQELKEHNDKHKGEEQVQQGQNMQGQLHNLQDQGQQQNLEGQQQNLQGQEQNFQVQGQQQNLQGQQQNLQGQQQNLQGQQQNLQGQQQNILGQVNLQGQNQQNLNMQDGMLRQADGNAGLKDVGKGAEGQLLPQGGQANVLKREPNLLGGEDQKQQGIGNHVQEQANLFQHGVDNVIEINNDVKAAGQLGQNQQFIPDQQNQQGLLIQKQGQQDDLNAKHLVGNRPELIINNEEHFIEKSKHLDGNVGLSNKGNKLQGAVDNNENIDLVKHRGKREANDEPVEDKSFKDRNLYGDGNELAIEDADAKQTGVVDSNLNVHKNDIVNEEDAKQTGVVDLNLNVHMNDIVDKTDDDGYQEEKGNVAAKEPIDLDILKNEKDPVPNAALLVGDTG